MLSSRNRRLVQLLDVSNKVVFRSIETHGSHHKFAFSPGGRFIVTDGMEKDQLCIWNVEVCHDFTCVREVSNVPYSDGRATEEN